MLFEAKVIQEPPLWWNRNLYSFLRGMPPRGWVWEFIRRAVLRRVLPAAVAVEVMNPHLPADQLDSRYRNLYCNWNVATESGIPLNFPPAAFTISNEEEPEAHSLYNITDPELGGEESIGPFLDIRMDLGRRNTSIGIEIQRILTSVRREHHEPEGGLRPNFVQWADRHILEVWDLSQSGLEQLDILCVFEARPPIGQSESRIHAIRSAHRTATQYIDHGAWRDLALHINLYEPTTPSIP